MVGTGSHCCKSAALYPPVTFDTNKVVVPAIELDTMWGKRYVWLSSPFLSLTRKSLLKLRASGSESVLVSPVLHTILSLRQGVKRAAVKMRLSDSEQTRYANFAI